MNRKSIIGLRKPITLKDLRSPIELVHEEWFPVYSFEGYYDISTSGYVRNARTGEFIPIYKTSKFDIVVLKHPDNFYVCATFNLIDIYSASILGETERMTYYSYRKGNTKQDDE